MVDPRLLDGVGIWFERRTSARSDGRPAVFLDRDGVVVEEMSYLRKVEDIKIIEGAPQAIHAANKLGLRVVVVTNQSGIGRQYYTWQDFDNVQRELDRRLASFSAQVDLVLACAYHEAALGRLAHPSHPWRKPNPGMIVKAAEYLRADLSRSLIVGDRLTDLLAGKNAGVGSVMLVKTGYGAKEAAELTSVNWSTLR